MLVSLLAAAGLPYVSEPRPETSTPPDTIPELQVPAEPDTMGTVAGRVSSEMSGSALPFAVVEVVSADRAITSVTDSEGRYRLSAVPPGSQRIRAQALDHSELVVGIRVPPGGDVALDLTLAVQPIEMAPLNAEVARPPAETAAEKRAKAPAHRGRSSPAEAELRMLESSPGVSELGLAQIIQATAGPDPNDPSSVLYVRGAASDLKLVLLDGAPVYAPFHLGGLIEAFMPGVLGRSQPFVGGAPARYNGGLSYILDMGSRPGQRDRLHTTGAIDMMSARAEVDGPMPGGAFLVGGRFIHGEGPDRLTGDELPYDYRDGLIRLDWGIGREGVLSVTGFFNREGVDLTRPEEPLPAAGDTPPVAESEVPAADGDVPLEDVLLESGLGEHATWGNAAGSLQYRGRAFDSDLELTAAFGEFTTNLPMGGSLPLTVDARSRRTRLAGVLVRSVHSAQVEFGASYDRVSLVHAVQSAVEDARSTFSSRNEGESVAAHAEATLQLAPVVLVRGGLRADYFFADGMKLAPRVSVGWNFIPGSELSVAAGRYHQRVLSPETLLSSEIGGFDGVSSENADPGLAAAPASPLRVSSATHFVVGVNSQPLQHLTVSLEGYVKSFDDLPVGPDLESSGIDFWVHRSAGDINGWIGYSVAWYRPDEPSTATRVLGRQLVSGGFSAQLLSGFGVDLNLTYGVALPYTAIPRGDDGFRSDGVEEGGGGVESPLLAVRPAADVSERGPPLSGAARGSYLRLDGTIYRTWVFNLSGIPVSISPYLRILNALDRRDGLFFQFDPEEDRRPVSLGAVPIIPLIGVAWGL